MKTIGLFVIFISCGLLLAACAPTPLNPNARTVYVGYAKPASSCKYLGQITGGQGGSFTGSFTADRNLMQGSMNDLRNQAYNMGGNYVQIINKYQETDSSTSGSSYANTRKYHHGKYKNTYGVYQGSTTQKLKSVLMTANVFRCRNR